MTLSAKPEQQLWLFYSYFYCFKKNEIGENREPAVSNLPIIKFYVGLFTPYNMQICCQLCECGCQLDSSAHCYKPLYKRGFNFM